MFGIEQFGDLLDIRAVLCDPVKAGYSCIEGSELNITADFLRSDETKIDLRILLLRPTLLARRRALFLWAMSRLLNVAAVADPLLLPGNYFAFAPCNTAR